MAFGAVQKFPNDTRPRVGIGVDIPFSAGVTIQDHELVLESISPLVREEFLLLIILPKKLLKII